MFYIIERKDQLDKLGPFGDCFIDLIPHNDNFHPSLTQLNLIYVRPIDKNKGYMLCIDHNEAFKLNKADVIEWLSNNGKLWVLDKKEAMYWINPLADKLFDAHLLEFVNLVDALSDSSCISYYYTKHTNLPNVNCLIPISKHYEECEKIFAAALPIIQKYTLTNTQFQFQNFRTTNVFYKIEESGIKVDKECYINYYQNKIQYPEFNLSKSRLYTQYNLYNTTSRPSNTCNSINFSALNKDNGERECYRPSNDIFIEIDFQGYHPRLIGELVEWHFPNDRNTYKMLGQLLGVTQQEAKELTFKQLYGGVWSEYKDKPFFKQVDMFIDEIWDTYQYDNSYSTANKIFTNLEDVTPNKLFNYIIQSTETSTNVELLELVFNYLDGKKTKLILYTYDAFLFDYAEEDGNILQELTQILEYPVSIKQGKSYHGLTKI